MQSKCFENTIEYDLKQCTYLYKDIKKYKSTNVPIWEIYTLCDVKLKITRQYIKRKHFTVQTYCFKSDIIKRSYCIIVLQTLTCRYEIKLANKLLPETTIMKKLAVSKRMGVAYFTYTLYMNNIAICELDPSPLPPPLPRG